MRRCAIVVASALLGAAGCDGCSRSRTSSTAEGGALFPGTSAGVPAHDPDVAILHAEPDGSVRNYTRSDLALSDDEVFWIDLGRTRVLALSKASSEGAVPRVAYEADGGRIDGVASSADGVYVVRSEGWRGSLLHVGKDAQLELARLSTRFSAVVAMNDAVTVLEADGISVAKRGAPASKIASFDFGGHLTACPFGAVWLATRVPHGEAGLGLEELSDARAHKASSIVAYRTLGGVTTLVSGIVDDRFGDLACDAESVYWSDISGVHRVLANGNGTPTVIAKPPAASWMAMFGTGLYWGVAFGMDRLLPQLGTDAGTVESFTRDDAPIGVRPVADATHVYWLSSGGLRRKRR